MDRAVRPHAALNHARTFFTFRSFNGALFEGLPLWGWRRDFSRSPSGNSRNTTNGSFHPYLRPGSASLFLLATRWLLPPPPPSSPTFSSNRLFPDYFYAIHGFTLAAPVGISVSFLEILGIGNSPGISCIAVGSWNCFRIEFSNCRENRESRGELGEKLAGLRGCSS